MKILECIFSSKYRLRSLLFKKNTFIWQASKFLIITIFYSVPESASATPSASTTSWATCCWNAARRTSQSGSTTARPQHEDSVPSDPTALPSSEPEVPSRECFHQLTWTRLWATGIQMLATACPPRCTLATEHPCLVTDIQHQVMA